MSQEPSSSAAQPAPETRYGADGFPTDAPVIGGDYVRNKFNWPVDVPDYTMAQAVARINDLRPIVQAARDEAFQKCPQGLSGLAHALLLYDDGVYSAEVAISYIRETLAIGITPESVELGELQAALYQGRFHGKASASAAGG